MSRGWSPSLVLAPALAVTLALPVGGGCKPGTAATDPSNTLAHANESWCPEGFESGPNDTCFALPDQPTKETPILVYLHGMYQGHGSLEEWGAVRLALQRGFAVVIPRGKRGLCAWSAEVKDHYCWPTDFDDTPTIKGLIAEWDRVLWQVDALLEPGSHKRYVLGFASGGFFAALVAFRGFFPAQAYAVVNGGQLVAPAKSKSTPPMLLIAAADDRDQGPKMRELHDGLTKASWAHAFCSRPGSHPLTPDDVEMSVRFFKREGEGSLKPQAGSYPCETRR
jgi:poly(3-hydroxybutyrate) depolymerase